MNPKEPTIRKILESVYNRGCYDTEPYGIGDYLSVDLAEQEIKKIIDKTYEKGACAGLNAKISLNILSVGEIQKVIAKELGNEAYGVEKVIAEHIHNLLEERLK